jgi:hypothetical protein
MVKYNFTEKTKKIGRDYTFIGNTRTFIRAAEGSEAL